MTIWAGSFVLVKLALPTVGPLTIAGLRYFLAYLVLLPFVWIAPNRRRPASRKTWLQLALLGIIAYALGNGTMFWALKFIPATTGSLLFGMSPLIIMGGSALWLREIPVGWQIAGTLLALVGSALFFSPGLQAGEPLGLVLALAAQVSFTAFGLLSRDMARHQRVDTLTLTALPLGIGGSFILLVALLTEGLPHPAAQAWLVIAVLAVVNSALGYILYNHALQTLTALEMNVMLNLGPLGTALIAAPVLAEKLLPVQVTGVGAVVVGVVIVQWFGQSNVGKVDEVVK